MNEMIKRQHDELLEACKKAVDAKVPVIFGAYEGNQVFIINKEQALILRRLHSMRDVVDKKSEGVDSAALKVVKSILEEIIGE